MKKLVALGFALFIVLASCSGKMKNIYIGKSFAVIAPSEVSVLREPNLKGDSYRLEEPEAFVVEDVVCEGGDYTVGCVLLAIDYPDAFFYKVRFESGKEGYIKGRYFLPEVSISLTTEERSAKLGTTPEKHAEDIRNKYRQAEEEVKAQLAREIEEVRELERTRRAAIEAAPWPDEEKAAVLAKRVVIGMTTDQVVLAWGPPDKIVETATTAGEEHEFTYNQAGGVSILHFTDGKLDRVVRSNER